ncbi:hypothetical protein LEAN103870_17305 [Legionella anisa]|uniref:DrrA phosphatidylinositol 4-phosphate binding domain-containing protein n=1 Tax=Legionella anisa TaxID=28082 RepID=A0AAX0WVC3_9GAMM|nr:hypothetical protein [Legionella anisa]AWN74070.1 hypothetical protein DLD14_09565 [Legionella anisa]KTC74558.1 hypothetical protein Lani_0759 [Legionella anisa]MBN5936868.1 hypothetical protein [Legionella anisa]MCW8425909.1 hypothetical protein [Legionella anisa]MCW8448659.1 hypothetical protein [Legionella anisa]
MARSHVEMAHVLGLQDNPFLSEDNTGWFIGSAVVSIKNRYKQLKNSNNSDLNFDVLPSSYYRDAAKKITDLSHGGYVGFSCRWPGHAFTLHAVKENDHTHFIYVNRGDPATEKRKEGAPTVMAFSVENKDAESFAKAMMSAAMSLSTRTAMSKFLEKHHDMENKELSRTLKKKNQKTGNCTVANSNIAWHFQLASDEMKKNGKSFAQAYEDTKSQYREMRVKDRVQAFKYLLNDRGCYLSDTAFLYNYLQTLEKFVRKDYAMQNQPNQTQHIKTLVDELTPNGIAKLVEPLVNENFTLKVDEYINARREQNKKDFPKMTEGQHRLFAAVTRNNLQSAKSRILTLAFKELPQEKQKELIAKDVSLIEYASKELQLALLQQNYNKYALYVSKEIKSTCNEYQTQLERESQETYQQPLNELSHAERGILEYSIDMEQRHYKAKSKQIAIERKTSGNFLLSQEAEQKEAKINNALRALYSYLSTGDQDNAKKTFEELCRACCERRFYLGGDKYSTHVQSAKWLIERINAYDETGNDFRTLLGIENNELHEINNKVRDIISGKNRNNAYHSISFKERYQEQNTEKREVQILTQHTEESTHTLNSQCLV